MRSRPVAVWPIIALVLAALFVVLATWIGGGGTVPGDNQVLVELDETFGTTLDDAMVAVGAATDSLVVGVVAVIAVAVLAYTGRRVDALVFAFVVGTVLMLNPVLKYLIARDRPDVRFSPEVVSPHSFPSGHAANTAALVGALVLVASTPRSRAASAVVGAVLLVVVGFSRLVIGVHYPSDVVGGWLWAASLLCAVWSISAAHSATQSRRRRSTGAGR